MALRLGVCVTTGLTCGTLSSHAVAHVGGPLLGTASGVAFWLVFARRELDLASGLLWGSALAYLAWLATIAFAGTAEAPMIDRARAGFPQLVADVVSLGLPIGLALGIVDSVATRGTRVAISIPRAIVGGGVAGLVGGWAFGVWMARVHFFPLVAGLVGSRDVSVGIALNFAIAVVIGASFGLLFQREILGLGSSIVYGVGYGLLWWFIGPLTLLPALSHRPIDWTAANASLLFGSLVGHLVYGTIVGTLYGLEDRAWKRFFYESDPLNREAFGGIRMLGSVGRGALASLVGGGIFSVVMLATGTLPRVAALAHGTSIVLGFFTHMVISAIIGATYGYLFRYEAPDVAASLAWGLAYGAIWWFLGALTLFPILSRSAVRLERCERGGTIAFARRPSSLRGGSSADVPRARATSSRVARGRRAPRATRDPPSASAANVGARRLAPRRRPRRFALRRAFVRIEHAANVSRRCRGSRHGREPR